MPTPNANPDIVIYIGAISGLFAVVCGMAVLIIKDIKTHIDQLFTKLNQVCSRVTVLETRCADKNKI